jgi:hypothetical protein
VAADPLKTLRDHGLPSGAIRPAPRAFDDRAARDAILALLASDVSEQGDREALVAWLSGFRHHWPQRFSDVFGQDGEVALQRWAAGIDVNHYLKLRRIAVENLAQAI